MTPTDPTGRRAGGVMSTVHVTPTADAIPHDDTDDCICGPTSEPIVRDDGSVGWVVIHHSLDGREGASV
mgnify:CR=1 FL=1